MKKIITLFLLSAVALTSLFSCGSEECTEHTDADKNGVCDSCSANIGGENGAECTAHKDKNDDGKCDVCGTDYTDGDEEPDKTVSEKCVLVMLDDGRTAAGVGFTLSKNGKDHSLTSGEDGKVIVSDLEAGSYTVSYDYETLPVGCIPATDEVEVLKDTKEIVLIIIDNTPNGSPEKPFFISEDITEVVLGAKEEFYYNYRGAAVRFLEIKNEGISVTYKNKTYSAENGVVTVTLEPTIGAMTTFSVKNVTDTAIETAMELIAPLGSMDNPIVLEENSVNVTVPEDEAIYYLWIADKDGMLLVTSQSEFNNIALTNMVTNAVSAMTAGSGGEYITVSKGDAVRITVASTDDSKEVTVDVSLKCYSATAEDPVPFVKNSVGFPAAAGESFTFAAEAGKTVTIEDENVSVTVGDTTYTPNDSGTVSVTLDSDEETVIFTVTNTLDDINGITVVLK